MLLPSKHDSARREKRQECFIYDDDMEGLGWMTQGAGDVKGKNKAAAGDDVKKKNHEGRLKKKQKNM